MTLFWSRGGVQIDFYVRADFEEEYSDVAHLLMNDLMDEGDVLGDGDESTIRYSVTSGSDDPDWREKILAMWSLRHLAVEFEAADTTKEEA